MSKTEIPLEEVTYDQFEVNYRTGYKGLAFSR